MNKKIQLLLAIIVLITGSIKISAQNDINIKLGESDIQSLLNALIDAHGINYGKIEDNRFGYDSWFVNVDQASIDIKPNNVINLNVALVMVVQADLLVQFPLVNHHSLVVEGHLMITGNLSSGYKLIYKHDEITLYFRGYYVGSFPDIEINLGTSILPASLSSLFTSGIPQITTTESDIILGFDLQGSDYYTVKNNCNGTNNSGLVTINGAQKYSPYSGQISNGGSATISAIDQIVDGASYKFSHWSNGSTSRTITINQPGVYSANFTKELFASIAGPTTLNKNENGTYTCNASGGNSLNYNYQWEIKKNDDSQLEIKGRKKDVIIQALPANYWFDVGDNSYQYTKVPPNNGDYRNFDLRCTVTDADNTQHTSNIINVSYNGATSNVTSNDNNGMKAEIASNKSIVSNNETMENTNAIAINSMETGFAEEEYSLGNYPNPFNPTTTISYQLKETGFVCLKVYNSLGQEVSTLVNENKSAGRYDVKFDASSLSSGIYFYTLRANGYSETKRMLLVK